MCLRLCRRRDGLRAHGGRAPCLRRAAGGERPALLGRGHGHPRADQARPHRGGGGAPGRHPLVRPVAGRDHRRGQPVLRALPGHHPQPQAARQPLHLPGLPGQPARHLQAHRGGAAQDRQAPGLQQNHSTAAADLLRVAGLGRGRGSADPPAPHRLVGIRAGGAARRVFRRLRPVQRPSAGGLFPLRRTGRGAHRPPPGRRCPGLCPPPGRQGRPPAARRRDPAPDPRHRRPPARGADHPLSLPGRGRGLSRRHRPGPARRRHGPGQDPAGHRRGRLAARARGGAAGAGHLPGLAQAPVGAGDRAVHRAGHADHPGTGGGTGCPVPERRRLPHRQLRTHPARPGGAQRDPVPGPGDHGRGPAHQELAHQDRQRGQAHPQPLRLRAHRHAAGKPAGGPVQPHAGGRPAGAGAPVALPGGLPRHRRARQGARLP